MKNTETMTVVQNMLCLIQQNIENVRQWPTVKKKAVGSKDGIGHSAAEHEKLDLKRQPFTSLEDDEEADVFDERQEAYGTECLIHKLLCFVTAYIVSLEHLALIFLKNYLNFN